MSRRRTRGRAKIQKRKIRNIILSVAGGLALVAIIVVWLASGQIEGNSKQCKEIGLRGSLGVLGFDSCKIAKDKKYDSIYFVVGNTMNSPKPVIGDEIKEYVASSIIGNDTEVSISMRSVTPTRYEMRDVLANKDNAKSLKKEVELVQSVFDQIDANMSGSPKASNADYYGAIEEAASDLSGDIKKDKKCLIVVIGSGLSDWGILNFADAGLMSENKDDDVDRITNAILDRDILRRDSSFSSIDIVWQNAGVTVAPQSVIDRNGRDAIEKIYERILKKVGFDSIEFINQKAECLVTKDEKEDSCGYKSVETNNFIVNPTRVFNPSVTFQTVTITENEIVFEANSAEFASGTEERVRVYLKELADKIKNEGVSVTITGYIAHDPCDDPVAGDLAKKRADKIADELHKQGIDGSKLIARDGGFGQFAVDCLNGIFNSENAAMNRVVVIEEKVD